MSRVAFLPRATRRGFRPRGCVMSFTLLVLSSNLLRVKAFYGSRILRGSRVSRLHPHSWTYQVLLACPLLSRDPLSWELHRTYRAILACPLHAMSGAGYAPCKDPA